MDKFLKRHKLSKFTEEIDNLNSPVSIKEIELVKTFPLRKSQAQMASLLNSA